jgi:hypothetical protein
MSLVVWTVAMALGSSSEATLYPLDVQGLILTATVIIC